MIDDQGVYVIRAGVRPGGAAMLVVYAVLAGAAVAGVVLVSLPGSIIALIVCLIVIFGALAVPASIVGLRRPLILRVDASGVTLGPSNMVRHGEKRFYRWAEIDGLISWYQFIRARPALRPLSTAVPYFGVLLCADAVPAHGVAGAPGPGKPVSSILVPTSIVMSMWRLDHQALAAVLARVAPRIRVVDIGDDLSGVSLEHVRATYFRT